MPAAALVLALTAALFHSCWNALTKGARDQFAFLCLAVAVASVVFLPVTLWSLPAGGVPAAAWPYLIATIVLHALYFWALGRSYRSGGFGLIYPLAVRPEGPLTGAAFVARSAWRRRRCFGCLSPSDRRTPATCGPPARPRLRSRSSSAASGSTNAASPPAWPAPPWSWPASPASRWPA